jgi:E3 ubiquitin-protein ligase SspH2
VISTENNAEAFSVFVSELADTASGKNNRAFQQEVAQWLTALSVSPSLRQSSFAVAQRARASGENSLAHTYNAMQNAALTHDVKSAKYDNALPELVCAGREMFRRERLEQVAQAKADTLYLGDEFEVYLALQSLLHDALELRSGTLHLSDFEACGFTQDELDVTEMKVKTAENHQFINWLAQWAPCHSVLQRLEPEAYDRATRARHEAIEGISGVRGEAQAVARGLDDDLDARAEISKTVMEAQDRRIFVPAVEQLLNDRKLGFLLAPRWPL